jgi:hypothetical protein
MRVLILDSDDAEILRKLIAQMYGLSDRERDFAHKFDLIIKRGIETDFDNINQEDK